VTQSDHAPSTAVLRPIGDGVDRLYAHLFHRQVHATARPYLMVLDRIHQYLVPRTYVEVGVSQGRSLALALPGTVCVGVDPAPKIAFPVPSGSRIFPLASDDFFESVDVPDALGHLPLDLAFIDGMHRFEFALRDFMHLERLATADTTVLVHDCLPPDEASASRQRTPPHWTGDVWKTMALLRELRPDLDVAVADVGPTGLGIIRRLDPASTVLHDRYDEITERYLAMPYGDFERADKRELIGLVPGDWETIRALLPDRPFRSDHVAALKARRLLRTAPAVLGEWARVRARRLRRRPAPP